MPYPKSNLSRFLVLLITCCVAYIPVLFQPATTNPDAQFIIPSLLSSQGISGYLNNLFHLRTIDIQPVRDLSLWMDILIFQFTGVSSMVFQNVIFWSLSVFVLFRILENEFREKFKKETLFFICLLFLVYPLFSQTISWGVARKHVLSFLFGLLATHQLLADKKGFTLFYSLSVFSQPISLLLPVWAILKRPSKKLVPAIVIMLLAAVANYIYYTESPVFRTLFGQKTDDAFALGEKLLATGHYTFQLIFPYLLSQIYTLGHWSTLAGLIIFVVIASILIKSKSKAAWLWAVYIFLPLSIVIVKSTTLYDTYLLFPAAGLLMMTLTLVTRIELPKLHWTGFVILTFFFAFTLREANFWNSEIELTKRSFERRPECLSAIHYLRMVYENGERPGNQEAKNFLRNHECQNLRISGQYIVNVEASLMYYEEDFPLEKRVATLERLSKFGIYPQLALAALYINAGRREEAREQVLAMIDLWQKTRFKPEYIPLVHLTIEPFCEKEGIPGCRQLISPFVKKRSTFSYH